MTSKGERPSCRAQSSRVSWMRARVQKAAQGLATLVAIATAFTFTARADYTVIDSSTTALALGGASGGDEIRRIDNDDGTIDLIHIFTNTASAQTFTLPDNSRIKADQIRLLIVGGGGAGHGNCGGGGGAGGVVTNTQSLASGTYTIRVGAGGTCPTHDADYQNTATNGSPSTLELNEVVLLTALGGGRGAGYSNLTADNGGSGGGGGGSGGQALQGAPTLSGGLAYGLGNAGGNGANNYGGGGGGAGEKGGNATSSSGGAGGAGGAGVALDITGENAYYAGGGGGGTPNGGTAGKGGSGIGGKGSNAKGVDAESGKEGTGSGGGGGAGGGPGSKGGAGGSGIVVIRYTVLNILDDGSVLYAFTKTNTVNQLTLPKAAMARLLLVGGGGGGAGPGNATATQGGAGGGGAGGLGGNATTANVGASGGVGKTSAITGVEEVYAAGGGGGSRTGTGGTGGSGIGGTGGGASAATPGTDGTGSGGGGGSNTSKGGNGGSGIVIIRVKYVMPEPPEATYPDIVYDGETHKLFPTDELDDGTAYTITLNGDEVSDISVKAVGTYVFTTTPKTGYAWSDGTSGSVTTTVKVTKPNLVISSITHPGWQLGEVPTKPTLESNIQLVEGTDFEFVYSRNQSAPISSWTTTAPTEADVYYVTARVNESPNYEKPAQSQIPVARFEVWSWSEGDKYLEELGYHAKLTVSGYAGAALTDFPMLVKVSEDSPSGFHYKHTNGKFAEGGIAALDLRFIDSETGDVLPFEVATWNPEGESTMWVKVPTYANGKSVTMCWGELVDKEIPETPASTEVWTDYAGVWHMDGGTGSETLGVDATVDSTGNGSTAVRGTIATIKSAEGAVGQALWNDGTQGSPLLTVTPSDAVNAVKDTGFTVSFWAYYSGTQSGGSIYYFSRRTVFGGSGYAVAHNGTAIDATSNNTVVFVGDNAGDRYSSWPIGGLKTGEWVRHDIVYGLGTFDWYVNGVSQYGEPKTGLVALGNGGSGSKLYIGGLPGDTANYGTINGAIDEFRIRAGAVDTNRIAAEYGQVATEGYHTWGRMLMTPGACFKNRWLVEPTISKSEWTAGGEPAEVTPGVPVYGKSFYVVTKLLAESVTNAVPTAAGGYTVAAIVEAGDDKPDGTRAWGGLEFDLGSIVIAAASPYTDLSGVEGDPTTSGRILLVNDYVGDEHTTVVDQSYWLTNAAESAKGSYWIHSDPSGAATVTPYLNKEIFNELVHSSPISELCGATVIWYLDNVRIGNTYPRALSMPATMNFLPQSPRAKSISSKTGGVGEQKESAHLVMRNTADAAIYSPCYTNGIGTIYFDAVNSGTNHYERAAYNLVLEVCKFVTVTNEDETVLQLIPTDENVLEIIPAHPDVDNPEVIIPETTNRFGRAVWEPVALYPLVKDGTESFVAADVTTNLSLTVEQGGKADNFNRVYAKLNYREPVRFRIRRVWPYGIPAAIATADIDDLFILVDNLIVSYPAMRVDFEPLGTFDATKAGKRTLGQELAFDVPFPAAGDSLVARAKPIYSVDPSVAQVSIPDLVTASTMYYRWRYLDQVVQPWQTVGLGLGEDGIFRAATQIEPGDLPGDVEFWYLLKLNAPFYSYVDYSGIDLGLADLYTENIQTVTNRAGFALSESRGTDWFVRLREGASDVEGAYLQIRQPGAVVETDDGEEEEEPPYVSIPMELIDNHIWRGYFQTPTNFAGTKVEYRVAIVNRQEAGSTELAGGVEYWANGTELNLAPVTSVMADVGEGGAWTPINVDAVTGYLLFQVDDESKALTIVHADYQNFNSWADAKGDLFVGSSTENDKKSGSAASKKEYKYGYDCGTMPATNSDWYVPSLSFEDLSHMGNRTSYKVFSSDTSDAWDVGQGMWVAKFYKDTTSNAKGKGVALQMAGQGLGFIQLTDRDYLPRGIETVTFNARLAQGIDHSDFCYYDADGKMGWSNYTFTARCAYDVGNNAQFRGNASLSMIIYYRPGVGFYEFRMEQVNANWSGGKVTGIYRKGQNFSLYRWCYDDEGRLAAEHLGTIYNNVFDIQNTSGENGTYTPMYISATNTADATCITMGVGRSGMSSSAGIGNITSVKFFNMQYRDTNPKRLKSGTFGALSANSPGVFLKPYYLKKSMGILNASIGANTYKSDNITNVTPPFPSTAGDYTSCRSDIAGGAWYIRPGRMKGYDADDNHWGVRSDAKSQGVTLSTRSSSKGAWTAVANKSVSSFGTPTGIDKITVNLYDPEKQSIRLSVDGDLSDVKRDVVIDSFEVTQWAGADWTSYNDVGQYVRDSGAPWSQPMDDGGSYTDWGLSNFVFTAGWLDGQGVLLSAKRTPTNSVASVRSPLMDGYTYLDGNARGIGLGMFSFSYEKADENVNLILQVATNNVNEGTIVGLDTWDESLWTTVTNFSFAGATDKTKGMRTAYVGLHGVSGVMRIVMDPAVVARAATASSKDFGSIRITEAFCRDEPMLDTRSWWGWNLRTVGADTANTDSEKRMYLPDYVANAAGESGLSLALNNSISDKIVKKDEDAYKEHMPFVQTPTFGTNVVGSVTFRARKYDASGRDGLVAVYGCSTGLQEDDTKWTFLTNIPVSASTYQTFTYTTDPGQSYAAFRLAVTGVDGVTPVPGPYPEGGPARVLVDEVLVSEAIRARMAFRNVGAFHTKMNDADWVPNVPSRNEQPLCNEGWGVQCEVFAAQLKDEIDVDRTPEVYLWYYASEDGEPWGFDNWKGMSRPRRMALAEGTNGFYRSSYRTAEDAVVAAVQTPGTVVQYMLEVRYWQKGHSNCVTNWMEASDWKRPEWYAPLDYNAGKSSFAAYSIMDTVPPGWAWINEINLSGDYHIENGYWVDSGKDCQFVEIAVPQSADMSMWSVRMLSADIWSGTILTNVIGQFGVTADLGGTKAVQKYAASNMVFRVLGSPLSHKRKGGRLDPAEGEIDATWKLSEVDENRFFSDGSVSVIDPFLVQLVRPTGIIEHELLCVGTNYWGSFPGFEQYYDPEVTAAWFNEHLGRESSVKYMGEDAGGYPPDPTGAGRDASLGVMRSFGHEKSDWSNGALRTPGKINDGQEIDGVPPEPNGETVIVFANVDNTFGRLRQQIGDGPLTNGTQVVYLKKGGDGTNIVYEADLWFELESVKTNNLAVPFSSVEGQKRRYVANVGAGCSNNVTVVAKAKVFDDLANLYGVGEDEPYRPAIVDWLAGGKTLRGDFEGDEIRLAEFWPLHGTSGSPMTLREMYWLDMDPTVGNLVLKGGMSKAPGTRIVDGYYGTDSWTNIVMGVTLYITNRTEDASDTAHYGKAWTPYVLRGIAPGENSLYYTESSANWTSVTFMVRGVLANGYTSDAPWSRNWVPLRWFVFNDDSFNSLDGSEGNPGETIVEVADPYSESVPSPATGAGWRDWFRKNGWAPIFFNWSINTNTTNWGVSPLKKVNRYETE